MSAGDRPPTLKDLRASGWTSKTVKQEIRANFLRMLQAGEDLFPGIVGYENTVLPEINLGLIAGHDLLFLGEKGQAKSRLMRSLARFLDDAIPYIEHPSLPVHEDPYHPITSAGKRLLADKPEGEIRIGWWPRAALRRTARPRHEVRRRDRRDRPGQAGGRRQHERRGGAQLRPHSGMHRGIFAMNEVPELDELVQVGLFNILEERDVQIRGYPIQFDLDVLILFSANPATYNRSGKVIPQLKDRIGTLIQTHYPLDRSVGIDIMEQEAGLDLDGDYPVLVPPFMKEVIEQISICARKSKYIDQASGVSARFSIANYRTMVASARHRGVRLGEKPSVPRISDLGHLYSSSAGKLELDMMGSQQMSERQVIEAVLAEAIHKVFEEYVEKTGLEEIAQVFGKGVKIEVGDLLPSSHYADRLKRVPKAWEKAFEVNPSTSEAVRASCIEFVLAGLYASDRISRSQRHGRITYEVR